MSDAAALARNTYIQFLARGLGTALGIVAIAMVTRALGPAGFGVYTTVISYLQVFGVLVDFGLTIVGLQLLSQPGADQPRLLGNLLALRLATAAIFLGVAPLVALVLPYGAEIKVGILFTTLSFLALALHQILTALFQTRLQMRHAALSELAGRTALVALVAVAAALRWGVLGMLAATTAANVVQLAVAWVAARRLVPFRLAVDPALWRRILTLAWPIGLSIAFNLIYLRADAVIISLTRSQEELGLYGAAYRVIDVLTVAPFLLMGLVLPRLVQALEAGDLARYGGLMRRSLRFLMAGILPIVAGGLVLGGDVMAAVSGRAFASSGRYLALLLFGVAMIFAGTVFSHAVVALGLQRKMLPFYAADAAVALACYLLFIPRDGAIAAAWITVLSEVLIAAAATVVVLRTVPFAVGASALGRITLAAAGMGLALRLITDAVPMPLALSLPLGVALYAALLLVLRALPPEDWRAILAPLRPRLPRLPS